MKKEITALKKFAEKNDIEYSDHEAQTGTHYITLRKCEHGDDGDNVIDKTYKIRVANHQDAYCTSDYSIDPCEGTLKGCLAYLAEEFKFDAENKKNNFREFNARVNARMNRVEVSREERYFEQRANADRNRQKKREKEIKAQKRQEREMLAALNRYLLNFASVSR